MLRLCNAHLDQLLAGTEHPVYDRHRLKPRIAHLGLGNFHRAHQAWYTDTALKQGDEGAWGICGISLRSPAVRDRLQPQDGLYTLEVRDGEHCSRQVIGSVIEILVSPQDPAAVIRRLSEADVVSLTVTEKAYCLDSSGVLDLAEPDLVHDLAHPGSARTVIGTLAAAFAARRGAGGAPQTVICCDNIAENGLHLAAAMQRYLDQVDTDTLRWLHGHVTFPGTMVDRIVPATTPEVIASVSAALGLQDQAPVITEPFSQWVIEDNFATAVPDWTGAGALVVAQVADFETAKLRMLNGSHSTLAYLGCLAGVQTVSDAVREPLYRGVLERLMQDEVQPALRAPAGLNLDEYRAQLLQRFANTSTRHMLQQIAMDGSQKLPPRLLGTIRDALAAGGPVHCLSLAVAAWMRYLRGSTLDGKPYVVDDPLAGSLQRWLRAAGDDAAAFMRASSLFGEDLPANSRFTSSVQCWLQLLESQGIEQVLQRANNGG